MGVVVRERVGRTEAVTEAPTERAPAAVGGLHSLLALQRSAGNAAVVAMLGADDCPASTTSGLDVGAIDDPAEAHADRVADHALRRQLNSVAFGTSTDAFFGGDGPPTVRRFMSKTQFEDLTSNGVLNKLWNNDWQSQIVKLLDAYSSLGAGRNEGTKIIVDIRGPAKLNKGIQLLEQMREVAIDYLKVRQRMADEPARYKGFNRFVGMVDDQIADLETKLRNPPPEVAAATNVDGGGNATVDAQETASLGAGMSLLSGLAAQVAPNTGDQGEAKLDLKIPFFPPVFLTLRLKLEIKRPDVVGTRSGATEISLEVAGGAGGEIPEVGDVYGVLGGYIKAQAPTTDAAMELISYGMYRRCRESDVVHRGIASLLWGEATGDAGYLAAEEWSRDVEQRAFDADNANYVESGGFIGGGAELDVGVAGYKAEGEAEGKVAWGKRYDSKSLRESAKGGAGNVNKIRSGWGWSTPQETTGRSTMNAEVAGSFKVAGLGGGVKLVFDGRADDASGDRSLKASDIEIKFSGQTKGSDMAQAITVGLAHAAKLFISLHRKELQKADKRRAVGEVLDGAYATGEVIEAAKEAPLANEMWVQKDGKTDPRPIGFEVSLRRALDDDRSRQEMRFELFFLKEVKVGAGIVKASLAKRMRVLGGVHLGDSWSWENFNISGLVDTEPRPAGEEQAQAAAAEERDRPTPDDPDYRARPGKKPRWAVRDNVPTRQPGESDVAWHSRWDDWERAEWSYFNL